MPLEFVEKTLSNKKPEPLELWTENVQAFELYQSVADQWRIVSSMAGIFYTAIDNQSIQSAFEIFDIDKSIRQQLFFDIKHIAAGAAEVLNGK